MSGNISIKLLYLTVVPILLISTVLGAYFISTRMQDVNTSLTDKGNLIAKSLSPAVEFGLLSHDKNLLKSLTEPLLSDSDVVSIFVLNKNRSTIVASISPKYSSNQLLIDKVDTSVFESTVYSTHLKVENILTRDLSFDYLENIEPELMGWVVVTLSHYSVGSRQNEILLNAVFLIILGVMGSAVVAYTMAKKIASPLLKLTDVVHEISGGNLNARADIDGVGEIYRLQLGVNVMADIIGQTQQALKKDVIKATLRLTETIDALEEKNSRLNATQHQLVQANAAKSEFLAKMSHEIRTPLTAVMGFSRLIEKAKNKHDIQAHTRIINQSGTQLLNIIDDILNFSKLENNKQDLIADDIDIRVAVEDVLNMLSSSAKVKKIALVANVSMEIPVFLRGDSVKLSQVLINLVNNAIKFTEKGFVHINVSLVESHDEQTQVMFEVSDTGIGIDANIQEVIFDSFSQVESDKNRSFEGAGLGLAICKKLIHLMSGEIGVTANNEKGSRFWFRIPLFLSDKTIKSKLSVVGSQHIVFYDKLPVSNQSLSKIFLSWHMDVYASNQLSDLLTIIGNNDVSVNYLVLSLDYTESNPTNVSQLVAKIRELYRGQIVILTSDAIEGNRTIFEECRNINILEKPVPRIRLRNTFDQRMAQSLETELQQKIVDVNSTKNRLMKKRRILLAEDNKFNTMLIQELLSDRFIDCDAVEDGKSVLSLATNTQYDMLLIDIHMPEMDGITLAQNIRINQLIDNAIPIIAFTADVYVRNDEQLRKKGINDVLYKPLTDESLDKILSLWLPSYRFEEKNKTGKKNVLSVFMSQRLIDDVLAHLDNIERSFRFDHNVAMNLHIHQLEGLLGHFQQNEMLSQLKSLKVLANTDRNEEFYVNLSQLTDSIQSKVIETA